MTLYTEIIIIAGNSSLGAVVTCLFSTVSDPDVPTLLNTDNIQTTSVTLTWNFGDTHTRDSSVIFYISNSSPSSWQTTTSTNELTGLTAGHTYTFYIEVTSFGKTALSANYTVTTRKFTLFQSNYFQSGH